MLARWRSCMNPATSEAAVVQSAGVGGASGGGGATVMGAASGGGVLWRVVSCGSFACAVSRLVSSIRADDMRSESWALVRVVMSFISLIFNICYTKYFIFLAIFICIYSLTIDIIYNKVLCSFAFFCNIVGKIAPSVLLCCIFAPTLRRIVT